MDKAAEQALQCSVAATKRQAKAQTGRMWSEAMEAARERSKRMRADNFMTAVIEGQPWVQGLLGQSISDWCGWLEVESSLQMPPLPKK